MNQPAARSRHLLACLGDPSRFRIVLSLLESDRCVTELAGEVGLSQSCTTRHLQFLEREGIVRGDRQGKRVMFRLRSDRPRVLDLLAWVTETPPAGLGGADLHGDRSYPPAGSGRGAGRAPSRSAGPGRKSRPRSPGHPPVSDLPAASDLPSPEPEPIPARPAEMEDWLL
jgi:DNA-binding transcriptional ArsR family regulator